MIKTKSLFDNAEESDGIRILVTRFYPRFMKEPKWEYWLQALVPRADHLFKYKHQEWTEDQLEAAYVEYLESHYIHASNDVTLALAQLTKMLVAGELITLLCYEAEKDKLGNKPFCHRHILKSYLERSIERIEGKRA